MTSKVKKFLIFDVVEGKILDFYSHWVWGLMEVGKCWP